MKARILVAAAVVVSSAQLVLADQVTSTTMGRPGLGVSAMGMTATTVAAPAVNAPIPNAKAPNSTPGVSATVTSARDANSQPGVVSKNVVVNAPDSRPGVQSRAPATPDLPQGYYTSIPATTNIVEHKGYQCYYVNGKYYRAEYYMGSLVYVLVP